MTGSASGHTACIVSHAPTATNHLSCLAETRTPRVVAPSPSAGSSAKFCKHVSSESYEDGKRSGRLHTPNALVVGKQGMQERLSFSINKTTAVLSGRPEGNSKKRNEKKKGFGQRNLFSGIPKKQVQKKNKHKKQVHNNKKTSSKTHKRKEKRWISQTMPSSPCCWLIKRYEHAFLSLYCIAHNAPLHHHHRPPLKLQTAPSSLDKDKPKKKKTKPKARKGKERKGKRWF